VCERSHEDVSFVEKNKVMEKVDVHGKKSCPNCHTTLANGHAAKVAQNGGLEKAVKASAQAAAKTNPDQAEQTKICQRWKDELNNLCSCKNGGRKNQVIYCQPANETRKDVETQKQAGITGLCKGSVKQ